MTYAFVGAGLAGKAPVFAQSCKCRSRKGMVVAAVEGGQNRAKQAKDLASVYGPAFVATSTLSSVVSISCWYAAIKAGVDVESYIRSFGDVLATTPLGRPAALDQVSPSMGTFALAYVAHKASSPLRFPILVAILPYVAKFFKKSDESTDSKSE